MIEELHNFTIETVDNEAFIKIVKELYFQGFKIIDQNGKERFKNLEEED